MMNVAQIERLTHEEAWPRLVQRVLANGRCPAQAIVERLCEPGLGGMAEVAGPALALQRVCELSWSPSELTDRLAAQMTAAQEELSAPQDWSDLMRSALVVRALDDLMALTCAAGTKSMTALQRAITTAGDRAARSAVTVLGGRNGAFPELGLAASGFAEAGIGAAVALWQAASSPTLRCVLPLPLLPDLARRVPGAAALVTDVVVSATAPSAAA